MTTAYASANVTIKNRTASHEIGHAFGLNHNNTIGDSTVMRTSNSNGMPTGPTINDFKGINYLY
ncbi:matrixin family metalloprotease [Carnobacterium gallinarum]|uniref:matrixin family metalloprotease n=1 Tax=Carnobacterium gallinarum TaxID=2749 RepID=UPI0012F8CC92